MFKGGQTASNDQFLPQVANHGVLKYPFTLNFYDEPPLFDVSIEDFETCALDRLRILAEIESCAARNRSWEECKTIINTQCGKYLPLKPTMAKYENHDAQRRKDHLSHFVLRLAFCRSEDLRRRFVNAETTLFKVRYEEDISLEREQFLESRDFNWIFVGQDEQMLLSAQLSPAEKYYKVKWTRVPDLVDRRRIFLKSGWAYVPSRDQSSIVFQEFEDRLERALEMASRLLPRLDEDTRLVPILNNLSQGFLAGISSEWANTSGSTNGEDIRADMVNDLATKHFPLCMRTLHENLRKVGHLKHFGRLQYGLFLKVLGLSVDEAIVFWRKSLITINDNQFNKEHKYNIRHSYGLEGKRANYPAKSCRNIVPDTECGCPYRTYSPENLQSALLSSYSRQGLRSADLPEIMTMVKGSHFCVACTRVFELTHSSCGVNRGEGIGGESVTHPNQYAAKSMELHKAKVAMVE